MASLNRVEIIGNLGQDPEVKYTPSGDAVATISVATTEKWKDKASGEMQEKVEWHRVTLWRRLGEIAGEYLRKGSQVYIAGKLQTRKWQDKDGNDRYTTEIIASDLLMLGDRRDGPRSNDTERPQRQPAATRTAGPPSSGGGFDSMSDDIPFGPRGARAAWSVE